MNLFEWRRRKKALHLARHLVRHARHMREDLAPAEDLAAARAAEQELCDAYRARDKNRFDNACAAAEVLAERLLPARPFPRWRENLEVLVVALSLAMACRTYFLQPFKIPTGSMQPTLNGVTVRPQTQRRWYDRLPFNVVPLALFGERYVEVRARVSGTVGPLKLQGDQYALPIGGVFHPVRLTLRPDSPFLDPAFMDPEQSMVLHVRPGDRVQAGQLIASGRIRQGDHVFVNKVLYHFSRPRRGQIVVFDTNYIPGREWLGIQPDTFYIKRLVGLPGETVTIRQRHLVVNDRPVNQPEPFRRLSSDPHYRGYVPRPGSQIPTEGTPIVVGPAQFLAFGDNTYSSLDGRYFGPVAERSLVGPAFFVYWPFGLHWGFTR